MWLKIWGSIVHAYRSILDSSIVRKQVNHRRFNAAKALKSFFFLKCNGTYLELFSSLCDHMLMKVKQSKHFVKLLSWDTVSTLDSSCVHPFYFSTSFTLGWQIMSTRQINLEETHRCLRIAGKPCMGSDPKSSHNFLLWADRTHCYSIKLSCFASIFCLDYGCKKCLRQGPQSARLFHWQMPTKTF